MTKEFYPSRDDLDDFISWLDCVLKEPSHTLDWADHLISQQDWSASKSVEISGQKTVSGNPEFYTF